jgi:hypothetical protein
MNDLYLIYINVIGKDWKGVNLYEFIFSESTEDIDGDEWDAIPAAGRPSAPYEEHVQRVGRLTTDEFKLHVIQESDSFSVWDSVDGVVALAWENMDDYDEYPENRLAFHFGEDIKSVEDKLYEQDLILEYNTKKNVGLKKEDKE